jgi:hypothetical protein
MKVKLTETQLRRILLKEGYSTNELFDEGLYSTGDLDDFLETVKENMINPEILDDFDKTHVETLSKTIRKSVADNFIKRINKNTTEEEMVKAFYDAINVTYNDDKLFNYINILIKSIWKGLDGKLKALANLGWATTRKSKIKAGIKEAISLQIYHDILAIEEGNNDKFKSLFEPAWSNNYRRPLGAMMKIDDEVFAAYETKGKGPFPYNIDHVTDQIYNAVDNL